MTRSLLLIHGRDESSHVSHHPSRIVRTIVNVEFKTSKRKCSENSESVVSNSLHFRLYLKKKKHLLDQTKIVQGYTNNYTNLSCLAKVCGRIAVKIGIRQFYVLF